MELIDIEPLRFHRRNLGRVYHLATATSAPQAAGTPPRENDPIMMMRRVKPDRFGKTGAAAAALLGLLLLAACTPMRWERDGLALDYNDRDWTDCRHQSIAGASRWMFDPLPRQFIGRDAQGRAFSYYRPSPFPNRFMLEQEYLDSCLRARGFRRVPVAPAEAGAHAPALPE
jgi:hypothetical protein